MTKEQSAQRIENARKCLTLIAHIAARGACSESPEQVGYALEELSQVLFERSGREDRLFEPIPADEIPNLDLLLDELALVDSFSSSMAADPVKFAPPGTWN